MTRPLSGSKRDSDGREIIAGDKGEGMHITLHSKPRRVPCRTPGFAYMPRGRGLTKFMLKPVSFGFSRLKQADANVTSGHFQLTHNSAGECPLHIFSMGTIRNAQLTQTRCGFAYKDNGTMVSIPYSEINRITDITSNNGESIADVSNHTLIWRKAEVNLLLYQREKQSTTFDITFFKMTDESYDPNESELGTQGSTITYNPPNVQNYWNPIVQRYTQNPATLAMPFPNALNRGRAPVRVLKKYRIVIREKLNTEDTINKRTVKFLLTPNQVMHYDLSPNYVQLHDVTGQGDINSVAGAYQGAQIVRYYPRTSQNIYMSIAANAYHDEAQSTDGYTQPSYDLAMRTTYDAVNAAT